MPREGALSNWIMPWNSEGLCNESVRRSVELASMASGDCGPGQRREASRRPSSRRRTLVAVSIFGLAGGMLASLWKSRFFRRPEAERRGVADRAKSVGPPCSRPAAGTGGRQSV